jgi:hypothetical protein
LLWFGRLTNRLSKPVAERVEAPVFHSTSTEITVMQVASTRSATVSDRLSKPVAEPVEAPALHAAPTKITVMRVASTSSATVSDRVSKCGT